MWLAGSDEDNDDDDNDGDVTLRMIPMMMKTTGENLHITNTPHILR